MMTKENRKSFLSSLKVIHHHENVQLSDIVWRPVHFVPFIYFEDLIAS